MFRIFQEEKIISVFMGLFLVLSILSRLWLGFIYLRMIKETDNMATTENKKLKQCKVKFSNCFQLNNGVSNISVFVDKFIHRLSVGKLTLDAIYHLSGQMMLLSVVCAGIGVCKSIASGRLLGEILPYYIVSFMGLYIFFSVSAMVDIKGKKRILKINLIDYLENHLSARIDITDRDIKRLYGQNLNLLYGQDLSAQGSAAQRKSLSHNTQRNKPAFSKEQEKELEELLADFLT